MRKKENPARPLGEAAGGAHRSCKNPRGRPGNRSDTTHQLNWCTVLPPGHALRIQTASGLRQKPGGFNPWRRTKAPKGLDKKLPEGFHFRTPIHWPQ